MGTSLKKEKEGKSPSQNDSYGQAEIQTESGRLNMITGLRCLRIKQFPQPTARQHALAGVFREYFLPEKQIQKPHRNGHGCYEQDADQKSKKQVSFHRLTLAKMT